MNELLGIYGQSIDITTTINLDDLKISGNKISLTLTANVTEATGQDGKTKYAIENSTRTRIVLADSKVHILGSFANIKLARNAICALILGSPPGKVYNRMRSVSSRMNQRG